jgi:hypothetical protein
MSIHNTLLRNINTLFTSNDWTQHGYTTVDSAFTGKIKVDEIGSTGVFKKTVRVNVMQYNTDPFYNGDRISGQIVCQIFVNKLEGFNAATQIADNLDVLLKKKTISGNLQTTNSLIKIIGTDPDNKNGFVCNYEVGFNYYN